MPSRRQNSSRPTTERPQPASNSPQEPRTLPDYVQTSAPLNELAINSLENLRVRSENVQKLQKAQARALDMLQDAIAGVHERATDRRIFYEKGVSAIRELEKNLQQDQERGKTQEEGEENTNVREKLHAKRVETKQRKVDSEDMRQRADEAHEKIETRIRQIIDGKVRLEDRQSVLSEVSTNLQRGEGQVAPTQSTLGASQFRDQHVAISVQGGDQAGNVDDQEHQRRAEGAMDTIKTKLDQRKRAYEGLSMRTRYAEHDDYIGFKRLVHDAQHQDDGVELGHSNTWFPAEAGDDEEEGLSHGTASGMPGTFPQNEDGDSEVEIARSRISTRCPITLLQMTDPMTSPCNHNFEAAAILEMLKNSNERIGAQLEQRGRRAVMVGGEQAIRCPEASCEEKFTERMLRRDAMIRRKIKRLQEQEKDKDNEYDDGGEEDEASGRHARAISVGTENGDGQRHSLAPRIKHEIQSSMVPRSSAARSVRSETSIAHEDDMDEDYEDS